MSHLKKQALGHSCQRHILKLGPEDDGFASVARSRQFREDKPNHEGLGGHSVIVKKRKMTQTPKLLLELF